MKTAILFIFCVSLSGCALFKKATVQTVVAPTGPATVQLSADVTEHIAKTEAQVVASTAALSKVSASAGAISTINAGQAVGPRTDGVENEAKLIQTVAGEPTVADKLAASERASVVAEGKAADIAKAYATAQTAAATASKELADTKTALTASNASLVAQNASAVAEQKKLATDFQTKFDAAIAAKDKEIADIKAQWSHNLQLWTARVLVGLGILAVIGGGVIVWLSGIAAIGKAGGIALGGLLLIGAGLIVGQPWFLWVAGAAVLVLIGAGVWYLIHLKKTAAIEKSLRTVVQDVKDAAANGVEKAKVAAEELKANLLYRIPRTADGNASSLEKEIDRRLVVEGTNAPATATATATPATVPETKAST